MLKTFKLKVSTLTADISTQTALSIAVLWLERNRSYERLVHNEFETRTSSWKTAMLLN